MVQFVVITRTQFVKGGGLFGGDSRGTTKISLVEAETFVEAADDAFKHCSVLDLHPERGGIDIEVYELGDPLARYNARYSGEPMTESRGATDAVLQIAKLPIK